MTPKEKAKELVNKMLIDFIDWTYFIPIDKTNGATIQTEAKQRALIAVELSLEYCNGKDMNEEFDKTLFLVKVKNELEKL